MSNGGITMIDIRMGEIEARFADMIWEKGPINSGLLAQLAEKELGWKKSTTYTILKRFCQKGIFQNEKGVVSALVTKEEFRALQSEKVVEESFGGSLPAFVAAFGTRKKLSPEEIAQLQQLVDAMKG